MEKGIQQMKNTTTIATVILTLFRLGFFGQSVTGGGAGGGGGPRTREVELKVKIEKIRRHGRR